jgi:hypothetical protein
MSYKPSGSYYKEFTTATPTTGAAANADSLPVATANHNGTDDGTFTLTVTNIDTGRYKITGTVPSGYAAGDIVNISIAATCSGVAGKAIIETFTVDTLLLSNVPAAVVTALGSITLPSGPVTAASPTSIAFTVANLGAAIVTGDLAKRRLWYTTGTKQGFLTDGCLQATIASTTLTMTFAAAQGEVPSNGDTVSVVGF